MRKASFLFILPLLIGCNSKDNTQDKEQKIKPLKNPYQHVVIFGVDGAGGEFENIETPNFDRIFGSGSVNYHGLAQSPTISAQNWGSMIYGVGPTVHQKTNAYIAANKHTDENLPSFIKTHSLNHPDATYLSAVNWAPINYGLFEDIPALTKENLYEQYPSIPYAEVDEKVAECVVNRLEEHNDAIVFTAFDSVDAAGHAGGHTSEAYKNSIKAIDVLLGQIYDAYIAKNLLETTLFIAVSDHGHTATGGHGGESAAEKAVMIAVNGGGNNIVHGSCNSYTTTDIAPIVLYALGDDIPSHYEGHVPSNMFITE